MIEIKVETAVFLALKKNFPKPANSAQRALDKYVATLTSMLLKALSRGQSPLELKLNLFSISLHDLANKGGQIGERKVRVHAWLRDNDLALVKAVEIGSNLTGTVSKVTFTDLVQLEWHEPEVADNEVCVDGVVLNKTLLDENVAQNAAMFNQLFPDYEAVIAAGKQDDVYDTLNIDIRSLQNYIIWLRKSKHIKPAKLNHQLFQSRIILAVAQHTSGKYFQRKKASDFGRMYYKGTSVQNVNKTLRQAMLGDCWEYDIRSSVVAWKMGFAKEWVQQCQPYSTVRKMFTFTLMYLEHKDTFIKNVQAAVFKKHADYAEEFQLKLLKQALTALSFGAKKTGKSWQDKNGVWINPALADIFKIKEEREKLIADPHIRGFIEEQTILDKYLFESVKVQRPDLLTLRYLQTGSGRPSQPKVIAFLYQHEETAVMDIVRQAVLGFNKTILANIHDAIILKQRLTTDERQEVEMRMREQTTNPYWRLGTKEIKRWQLNQRDDDAD